MTMGQQQQQSFNLDDFINNDAIPNFNIDLNSFDSFTHIDWSDDHNNVISGNDDIISFEPKKQQQQQQQQQQQHLHTTPASLSSNNFTDIELTTKTGDDQLQLSMNELNFDNELYQIISNNSSISSQSSSSSSNDFNIPSDSFVNPLESSLISDSSLTRTTTTTTTNLINTPLEFNQFLFNDSPYSTDYASQNLYDSSSNPSPHSQGSINSAPALNSLQSFESFSNRSSPESTTSIKAIAPNTSITPSSSSTSSAAAASSRSSLDSRLSLQKLGDILKTNSLKDTVEVEKFILNIFVKDLGFPLGYKTWIRDTNEKYRQYLLDELYQRVSPTYPELNKALLEVVIKRATYSMMQGRLRKERRAASKISKKRSSIVGKN